MLSCADSTALPWYHGDINDQEAAVTVSERPYTGVTAAPPPGETTDQTSQAPPDANDTTQPADLPPESSPWPVIDGKVVWAAESVTYLYDEESRQLRSATVTVWYDDGVPDHIRRYSAEITRDGEGDTWNWRAGGQFLGTHSPDIATLVKRAQEHGRMNVLEGVT